MHTKSKRPVDITALKNEVAISLLCAFSEPICTGAGTIEPDANGMTLLIEGRRPRQFPTASGALEVLRRIKVGCQ